MSNNTKLSISKTILSHNELPGRVRGNCHLADTIIVSISDVHVA